MEHRNLSLADSRVHIINPWHWASQCINKSMESFADFKRCHHRNDSADIQYNRGAVEFPKLLAKMAEIGRAINRHYDCHSLEADDSCTLTVFARTEVGEQSCSRRM